jgi:16S rRNA (guanine527-N7)-methyltransferase
MENFIQTYPVSRETYERLEHMVALLQEWQKKFNLVSRASLEDVWSRHIADSLQLLNWIPQSAKRIYDLGSGAGFPALVLAAAAIDLYPSMTFTLVESITKKTVYLNEVKNALRLDNVQIINDRTEHLTLPPADVVTARAVTSLTGLLAMSFPFCSPHTELVFPKGRSFQEEIDQARLKWRFDMRIQPSAVSSDGVILCLTRLRRK